MPQKVNMRTRSKAPLFETLLDHAKRKVISFHTPGHKNGRGIDKRLRSFTGKNLYHMDVTVFPEVDSLHDPTGPIKKAQELMAKAYGVSHSLFLVNGSTVGNTAMFLSACKPGDSVIVSRNSHKSIMAGIILSGVWPIWIQPKIDQNLDIIFDITPKQIEDAMEKFPEAKAVFVTSPTYNGITADLIELAKICHKHNKLLLVDEAHEMERQSFMDLVSLLHDPHQKTAAASLILAGLGSLKKMLGLDIFSAVRTRLAFLFQMPKLNADSAKDFLLYRLRIAQAPENIFEPDALQCLALDCAGNRRILMNLAAMALQAAAERNEKVVTADLVNTITAECRA